jgi:hypothetical protein
MLEEDAVSDQLQVVMDYHREPEGWWAEFYLERPVEVEDHLPASHPERPRARP